MSTDEAVDGDGPDPQPAITAVAYTPGLAAACLPDRPAAPGPKGFAPDVRAERGRVAVCALRRPYRIG